MELGLADSTREKTCHSFLYLGQFILLQSMYSILHSKFLLGMALKIPPRIDLQSFEGSTFSIFEKTSSLPARWELVSRGITCVTEDAFSACNGFRWSILSAGPWNPQAKATHPSGAELRNTPTPDRFTWQCDGLSCLFLLWAKLSRKKISPQP